MNERIAALKSELLAVKPGLSAERVVLASEAYQKYAVSALYFPALAFAIGSVCAAISSSYYFLSICAI